MRQTEMRMEMRMRTCWIGRQSRRWRLWQSNGRLASRRDVVLGLSRHVRSSVWLFCGVYEVR